MSKMNTGRVVLGGLVAGVVMNLCDFVVNNYVLAREWRRVAQSRNVDIEVMGGTSALVTYVVVDMLYGLVIVWLCAAMRPRLGPGPVSAMIAGVVVALVVALALATLAEAFFSWDLYIKNTGLLLASMLLAAIAGAQVYKEEEPEEPTGV
jgi:hypothetical protein